MSEARNQVVVDITIAAPIDMVWAALRERARIGQWFGWDAPSLAEEIRQGATHHLPLGSEQARHR